MNFTSTTGHFTHIIYLDEDEAGPALCGYRITDAYDPNKYSDVILGHDKMTSFMRGKDIKDYKSIVLSSDGLSNEEQALAKDGKIIFFTCRQNGIKHIHKIVSNENIMDYLDIMSSNFYSIMYGYDISNKFCIVYMNDIQYNVSDSKDSISMTINALSALSIDRVAEILAKNPHLAKYVEIDSEENDCTNLLINVSSDDSVYLSDDELSNAVIAQNISLHCNGFPSRPDKFSSVYLDCTFDGRLLEKCSSAPDYVNDFSEIKKAVSRGIIDSTENTAISLFLSEKELSKLDFFMNPSQIKVILPIDLSDVEITSTELSKNFWNATTADSVYKAINKHFNKIKSSYTYTASCLGIMNFQNKSVFTFIIDIHDDIPF